MATILPFLNGGVFDPKDIKAMSRALDDVCKSLNLREVPLREVVAERIIDLARSGIRSPTASGIECSMRLVKPNGWA
jgi:hypothetical protein